MRGCWRWFGDGMLRADYGSRQKIATRAWKLVVFSVGGRRLAAKVDEVVGVAEWKDHQEKLSGNQAIPRVFDLAALLHVSVRGDDRLCLTVRHPQGPMAICIDGEMPALHTLDLAVLRPYRGHEFGALGSFSLGVDDVPIIAFSQLVECG